MIATVLSGLVLLHAAGAQSGAAGVWRAEYTTSEGRSHQFTITLKVAADGAVAGTISSPRGSVPITEGTVKGREIAFTVTRRANYDEIHVVFKGTLEGERMQLVMQMGSREPVTVTASRETGAASQTAPDGSRPDVGRIALQNHPMAHRVPRSRHAPAFAE